MKKLNLKLTGFISLVVAFCASAQKTTQVLKDTATVTKQFEVIATRAEEKSAMVFTTLSKKEIQQTNLGQDVPFLLNTQANVVVNSDAGTGIGYTGIRVRGSDPSRINVTVNGIPMNDAESSNLYWVNTPDLASSIQSVQLQRGVGASTNGAGAFGATLSLQTNEINQKPYAELTSGIGSFNTQRNTVKFGTGTINNFSFDARLSQITSNGFIDRSAVRLQSYYFSGSWFKGKNLIRLNAFSGKEKTGQAWYGVPTDSLEKNRTYNAAGSYFENGIEKFYNNETDNYQQDHYQAFWVHQFSNKMKFDVALHYTKGRGYYEQYRYQEDLSNYGAGPAFVGQQTLVDTLGNSTVVPADTIYKTNLVRQLWLDNDFYGTVFSFTYESSSRLKLVSGGGLNHYDGDHFGQIVWSDNSSTLAPGTRYYFDNAKKTDFNFYTKATFDITKKVNLYVDLQYRNVNYNFLGFDQDTMPLQQNSKLNFFNPKAGVNYVINKNSRAFFSMAVGHREPTRDDFTQSSINNRPKPEQLVDYEVGYRYTTKNLQVSITGYFMDYTNQLVLSGEINNVGNYNRVNTPKSSRQGLELELGANITKFLSYTVNLAFSKNKIKQFTEYVDDYDTYTQVPITYNNTDISFSPSVVASSNITLKPLKTLNIHFITKYVGKQYLDNTQSEDRKIDAFLVNDVRINWNIASKKSSIIDFAISVNNIFNEKYAPNGYTYGGLTGGQRLNYNFYFPQAGTNFLAMLSIKFQSANN
jgi:iron complex outermembrane receptor protein